jgi:hypothetical protein
MWLNLAALAMLLSVGVLGAQSPRACPALPAGTAGIQSRGRCVELTPGFYAHWTITPGRGSITFILDLLPSAPPAKAGTPASQQGGAAAAPPSRRLAGSNWVALGISPSGSMKGADMVVFER